MSVVDLKDARRRRRGGGQSEIDDAVRRLNRTHALVMTGGRALILRESIDERGRLEPQFLRREDFCLWHGPEQFICADGKRRGIGDLWLKHAERRQYDGLVFAPEGAPEGWYNLWRGFEVEPRPGSWGTFRDHLLTNVCSGSDELFRFVFGWFAHLVQRPAERLGVALVLRGLQGTGKTKVGEVFGAMLRRHYLLVDDPRYIVGQFNAHLVSCLLLQADEGFWAGDKQAEGRLKSLITSERHMIERKGVDPVPVRNLVRLLVTSNNDWVVPAGFEERRFAVLDVAPNVMQNAEYFAEIDREMAAGGLAGLLHDLLAFDLSKVNLRAIPATSALFEQKIDTMSVEQSWWYERLIDGTPTRDHASWPERVPKNSLHVDYRTFADNHHRSGRKRTPAQLGVLLAKMIPGLGKSKMIVPVFDETGAPKRDMHGENIVKSVHCYILPPLESCRAHFAEMVRHPIDWGESNTT